jgi:hypothetical protein
MAKLAEYWSGRHPKLTALPGLEAAQERQLSMKFSASAAITLSLCYFIFLKLTSKS